MTSSKDLKVSPGGRIGHICAYDKGYMFVLGGYKGYNDEMQTNYLSTNELWIYDTFVEKWYSKWCTGETGPSDIPPGTSGATGCIINGNFYVFGGYNEEGNSNRLYRLNLKTFKWQLMEPIGVKPIASDKTVCWEYDYKLFLFGGYGCIPKDEDSPHKNFQFIFDPKSHWHYKRGWNNQLVYYDIDSNEWVWPQAKGVPPLARAAHAAARVGDRIFVFGGRHQTFRLNDIHFLDMKRMEWREAIDENESKLTKKPNGRSWHSLTALSDNQIVLFGGFTHDCKPMGDCWLFNTESMTWSVVNLPFYKPRLWHSAIPTFNGEVVVFGGAKQNILSLNSHQNMKDLYPGEVITLRFDPKSLLKACLETTVDNWTSLQKYIHYLPINLKRILLLKKNVISDKR